MNKSMVVYCPSSDYIKIYDSNDRNYYTLPKSMISYAKNKFSFLHNYTEAFFYLLTCDIDGLDYREKPIIRLEELMQEYDNKGGAK